MTNQTYEPTGEVDKRRVTMRNVAPAGFNDDGEPQVHVFEAIDYVRPDIMEAYLADARTRWDYVVVDDEPDAGPGGYHGETHVPEGLDHPLAGQTFKASKPAKGK